MKLPICIIFDMDEGEYIVFVQGLAGIEGRGSSEHEAIEDFKRTYERKCKE